MTYKKAAKLSKTGKAYCRDEYGRLIIINETGEGVIQQYMVTDRFVPFTISPASKKYVWHAITPFSRLEILAKITTILKTHVYTKKSQGKA